MTSPSTGCPESRIVVSEYPCHPPTVEAMLRVNVAMLVHLWLEDEGLLTQEIEQKMPVLVDVIMGEVKRRVGRGPLERM